VFDVNWEAPEDQEALGRQLVEEYDVRVSQLSDCSVCHL